MSWDLNIAEARDVYLTESDMWRYTQHFLMHAHHTTTYKHVLMKALLESLPEISDSGQLTFLQVTRHATKIYWNLTVTYKLGQLNAKEKRSGVEQVILDFQYKHGIPSDWNFERIPEAQKEQLIKELMEIYKKYVYGSFYKSFDGTIYSFNKREGWLQLAPPYIVFFEKYKKILMNVTNYQLALFLEKYNTKEAMVQILTKVEFVSARQSLAEFQQLLKKYGEEYCFYCNKALKASHVDHFVPWSYVQNDVLWNFVLACPACNSSKSNRLADNKYLEELVERNNAWFTYEYMETYSERKLVHMYDYAIQNGFLGEWRPGNRKRA